MAAIRNKDSHRDRLWNISPWAVLVIGIPLSLALFFVTREAVENVGQLHFDRYSSDAKHVIEARIHSYADILYGLQALIASQSPVSRIEFNRYVRSLDLTRRYPGYDVVNYAMYVPASEKTRFEQSVRLDTSLDPQGYPTFAIRPAGDRNEYFVMVYVEPMAGFEYAFGLDLGANPGVPDPHALANALRSARDTGELTASGLPIRVQAEHEYVGLAMRLPVYRSDMPIRTIEQRRAAYLGSVGAGFNVAKLMKGVLSEEATRDMRFQLYDVGPVRAVRDSSISSERRRLFDSNQLLHPSTAFPQSPDTRPDFSRTLSMEVGGRVWEIDFNAPKDTIIGIDALVPWLVLAGGLLSTGLLFGMFYSLASSRSRAVELANEMTRDLRASTEQLQALSRRLVDVQETERRQFSRELHDRIGQNLTALSINLDIMKSQIGENGNSALRTRLDDAATLLESTAGSIENVISELRPPMLDDYGLLPALQWYGNEFWRRTGIRVSVEGDEHMERVPQSTEIALFRIAQEALNNVAKHAHARHVEIMLMRKGGQVVLTVSDDGMGFEAAPAMASLRRRPGLGMVTMRERTQAVGGRFEIGPAAGRGARVMVKVPC